jgi:N-methylhydantoinase A
MTQAQTGRRDWLVGVDVGGTFTDGVLIRPDEQPLLVKSPTRVDDPVAGLLACLDRLAEAVDVERSALLGRTVKFAYGTTQAANMVVEGRGAKTAFLTTRGFRDTLTIAGMGRDRIGQDLTGERAPSLVPRRFIREVSERVTATGEELTPLNLADVAAAVEEFHREGVEAVGVCLLWSFTNDSHEGEVARYLREHGDWFVSASSECVPLLGEYERSATTALNARLGPLISALLLDVDARLAEDGLASRPLIMTSAGGLLSFTDAAARPVALLSSGPAGGVLASQRLAQEMGIENVLCGDMGGTTFDISLITSGEVALQERGFAAGQEIATSAIDIVSVGAGGGSIAWVEQGRRLKVGPSSASAYPGPACYGRGGTRATVTDANLLLGRLNDQGLAGGTLSLDVEAARRAVAVLGDELGLDVDDVAAGILRIVDAAMADAIHSQTISRGLDPRDYTMFAYGGGGALHAVTMALEIGLPRVVVPALAPVFSAYGVVASNLEHVLTRSVPVPVTDVDAIRSALAALEAAGHRDLALDDVPVERRHFSRSATLRFRGQLHSVAVPLPEGEIGEELLQQVAKEFVVRYEVLYGIGTSSTEAGIEVVTLTVRASGMTARPQLDAPPVTRTKAEPVGHRRAWVTDGFEDVARYVGPLSLGAVLEGPAVIDNPGNTVWVPRGVEAHVDRLGNIVMDLA